MPSLFDTREFNERLFFPRADRSAPPDGAIELDVPGDETLHVRWHRGPAGAPTLLLFHGNGETVGDYDRSANDFAAAGVGLAVMDYRGYGRSTGTPTLRTALADAALVLDHVRARVATPLIVMGRSLGSACAAELYGRAPDGVIAFVLESGFVDLAALIRRRGLKAPPQLDSRDRAAFDPVPKLSRGRAPLLVLHGDDDELIDPAEARRAYEAAGTADKQLVLVPGHGHNDIAQSPVYWDALAAFIARLAH
jgi:alpha-beta hydrolase superfamily lysophospholipase